MSNLVIVGSVGLDDVKTNSGDEKDNLGGSCSYTSVAASYFTDSKIIGVIGEDFPNRFIDLFKKKNIDISNLIISKGKTFRWKARYDNLNVAETLDTQLNVFADFNPKLDTDISNEKFFFLGNIDPKLQLNVLNQIESEKFVGLDTMNYWIKDHKENLLKVISKIDILFINEDEIKELTSCSNIFDAAEAMLKYNLKFVVVKKGEHGAFIYGKDFLFFSPVFPVRKVIDPTGAGDSFAGGFMGYLASINSTNKEDFKKAMIFGTVISSFNIEDFSLNRLLKISKEEINKRKDKLRSFVTF